MIPCKQCGGQTGPGKLITTVRGPATVHSCLGGCKNDKGYPLGTFAPKAPSPKAVPTNGGNEAVELLKKIYLEIQGIRHLLNTKITLKDEPLEKIVEEEAPF